MKKLYGTGVALVTSFTENREVDYRALRRLLNHTAKGVDYYVVMGTTGESATVTKAEKKQVLQFVKDNNSKKLPIVYGIGGNNTQAVLDEIGDTDFAGVDAVLSVSPYYNKPSQQGIKLHFEAIANACPRPVILYNVPGRTASNLTADTTLALAQHPNIAGVKEASGSIEQCMRIAQAAPKDFLLISGDDMLTVALYSIGAKGVISVLANALPVVFNRMRAYAAAGEFGKASKEQFKLLDINGPMYEEGNPVGVKYLLSLMGVCGATTRLPLAPASRALQARIADLYAGLKRKG